MSATSIAKAEPAPIGRGLLSADDPEGFRKLVEAHRGELLAHCYRFTGSRHDAEDLVQETFLRAWRGIGSFEGRSSVRNWLYRIATNACLNAASRKANARRVFPEDLAGPTTRMPAAQPEAEIPWIEPWQEVENVADAADAPAARYEFRETIRLAFIAATQRLPARQRAVLLLRDVLGWSAEETAKALKLTVAAVTSALQRARGTLGKGLSADQISDAAAGAGPHQAVGDAYADAWERADLDGLVALLARDAAMVMPPWTEWYSGRSAIQSFLYKSFEGAWKPRKRGAFRLVATRANGQIAFGVYSRLPGTSKGHGCALHVLTFRKGRIARVTVFVGPEYLKKFGLPLELDFA
jgi:RNA polymerase sigma-70 factor (ECF subfamily)